MPKRTKRSTKHKTNDRVTWTPLKLGVNSGASEGVSSSCSTSGTHLFNLVANPVISHENSVVFTMILVKKNAELAINNNHSLIPSNVGCTDRYTVKGKT